MKIGGFQKFTLIDYPGKLAAVVFTQGCNFRCPYCHNPELVYPKDFQQSIPTSQIFNFLKNRIGKLDAVSITGGEPTLQNKLPEFMQKIKEMGFLIKLDTNGTNPEMIEQLITSELVDYLAMDIKAPLMKYDDITKTKVNIENIEKSILLIENSGIEYEFRSTLVKDLLSSEDVEDMGLMLGKADKYFLQKFVLPAKLESKLNEFSSFSQDSLNLLIHKMQGNFGEFLVR
ncbi:MAG: anaerobic ribonucleoside-triphosphate reductase activating protein [Candidatus Cloacimonas sp. 4484_143]|nr:MAG: anaerobic ribonucleoside-triphosphate reductase activating protein [Candidatus Cloacimonas sp. 4484_143]RLC53287.1 MAG: anaerobic ribonucleoside-triphosphate reductase activating protein [Candidatus Cloacimonadota bacterium]RLC56568.1 MAG: anaerobic ribonucleoside-triphosphate reductase activating protein [Candidatus Cloacimonadota bacterium]